MARYLTKKALLERIYDSLYAEAEAVLKEFNFCDHRNVGEESYSCLSIREYPSESCKISFGSGKAIRTGCCGGCKYLTEKGCSAEKPLGCKTWLCGVAKLKNPETSKKLSEIQTKSCQMNLYTVRGDKTETINRFFEYNTQTEEEIILRAKELNISI